MRIFVTDVGLFWNHNNPILEKYADCVVVVCLEGKKVTDKYECVVSPYKANILGMDDYGVNSAKYNALKSVEDMLRATFSFHDDVIFLADNEPQSLYPYLVLKDYEGDNRMHLWCMSPFPFEIKKRQSAYYEMLQDLSGLQSLLYIDSNTLIKEQDKNATLPDVIKYCETLSAELLPQVVYEIGTMLEYPHRYYFDFGVRRFIETDDAFNALLKAEPLDENNVNEYQPYPLRYLTMGIVLPHFYPEDTPEVKEEVCQLIPRIDGKQVCELLKNMRRELAATNNIPFETEECFSTGPCAGTCPQCDKELMKLQKALLQMPKEKRVYPQFDIFRGFERVPSRARDLRECAEQKNIVMRSVHVAEEVFDDE